MIALSGFRVLDLGSSMSKIRWIIVVSVLVVNCIKQNKSCYFVVSALTPNCAENKDLLCSMARKNALHGMIGNDEWSISPANILFKSTKDG